MNPDSTDPRRDTPIVSDEQPHARKAGPLHVAKIVFFGLLMIGKKATWDKGSTQVSPGQIVVGAIIGGIVLVVALLTLVRVVIGLATG